MTREAALASLALAASVAAAAPLPRSVQQSPRPTAAPAPRPEAGAQEFQFRGLVFMIPAGWTVQRADQQRFRSELVTVTGRGAGARLTFSDSVRAVGPEPMPIAGTRAAKRTGGGLQLDRYQMPNPAWSGILYAFPEVGIGVSAQLRSEADARAADAIVQSARRALPRPAPDRN